MENTEQPKENTNFWQGSPKTMFALGLITGVAVMSTLALIFVVDTLLSGKGFNALAAGKTNQPTTNQVAQQPTTDPSQGNTQQQPTTPSQPVKAVDEKTDHIWGPSNAKVTLIEYSDFECPYCAKQYDTIAQIMKAYPKDVRIIYRHFPLSFHPDAEKAAEASECAAAQGKFWEMYNKIFEANKAGKMGVDQWKQDAKDLGLDTDKFNKCLDSGETAAHIQQDQSEGAAAGVGGTPSTFVNGKMMEGALPFDSFKTAIEAAGAKG